MLHNSNRCSAIKKLIMWAYQISTKLSFVKFLTWGFIHPGFCCLYDHFQNRTVCKGTVLDPYIIVHSFNELWHSLWDWTIQSSRTKFHHPAIQTIQPCVNIKLRKVWGSNWNAQNASYIVINWGYWTLSVDITCMYCWHIVDKMKNWCT